MQESNNVTDGVIVLPPDMRSACAEPVRDQLVKQLDTAEPGVRLDGKRVRQLDVIGLQVLLAFVQDCARRDLKVTWHAVSDELRHWTTVAGARDLLGIAP